MPVLHTTCMMWCKQGFNNGNYIKLFDKRMIKFCNSDICTIQSINSDSINNTTSLLNYYNLLYLRKWYIISSVILLLIFVIIIFQVTGDCWVSIQLLMTFMSLVRLLPWSLCFKSSKIFWCTFDDNPISHYLSIISYNRWTSSCSLGVSFNIQVISEITTK